MKTSIKWLMASATLAALAACGGGGDDSIPDRLDTRSPQIRLVDLDSTDQSPTTVTLYDNTSAIPNTTGSYKFGSAYTEIHDDSHNYIVKTNGVETNNVVLDPDSGTKYTLIKFGSGNANLATIRDPSNRGTSTDARIRVVNAQPTLLNPSGGANVYEVYLLPADPALPNSARDVQANAPFISNLAYRTVSPADNADSKTIAPATYELTVAMPANGPVTPSNQKFTPFSTNITLGRNDDVLIAIIPDPANPVPSSAKVLIYKNSNPVEEPADTP